MRGLISSPRSLSDGRTVTRRKETTVADLRRRAHPLLPGRPASDKKTGTQGRTRGSKMASNANRILTTHVGSLVRPPQLIEFLHKIEDRAPTTKPPTRPV